MCGICGHVGSSRESLIEEMTEVLRHRGPDDMGIFRDGDVALGHRRLSVIDLATGDQPMTSRDGSLVLVFNGEIYNYRELRSELESNGHTFATRSDTEVLLRMLEWKGTDALAKLNGMFAFALFDRRNRELLLARDRVGIKPLYYRDAPGRFLFASEAKAILCDRDAPNTVNPRAIHDYLALRYVPGAQTMFRELRRLPAGHVLKYADGRVRIERYWSPPQYEGTYELDDGVYYEQFKSLMETSVRRRLVSDVSFGAYLSGGVDSSVIVALMSKLGSAPVKTFSVGFDYEHDELNEAAATAAQLGCDHTVIECRARDVDLLPKIVHHMDEPMGDPINVPMYQLAREAKKQVTVILTGEGGDEIFGGYLFHKVLRLGELYRRMLPRFARRGMIEPLLAMAPTGLLNLAFRYPAYLGKRGKQKALDYLRLVEPDQMAEAYRHLISLFDARDTESLYTDDFRRQLAECEGGQRSITPTDGRYLNRMLRLSFDHWLPDNMLLRTDKMGMANAIEGRVPFLDHELIEFAERLPARLKMRGMTGKVILRRLAAELLPGPVARRKKMPFYVPIEQYFEQPAFQEMMNDLLSDRSVRNRGIFRAAAVERLRGMMHRREFLFVKQVFSLMVLELWFRIFQDRSLVP